LSGIPRIWKKSDPEIVEDEMTEVMYERVEASIEALDDAWEYLRSGSVTGTIIIIFAIFIVVLWAVVSVILF